MSSWLIGDKREEASALELCVVFQVAEEEAESEIRRDRAEVGGAARSVLWHRCPQAWGGAVPTLFPFFFQQVGCSICHGLPACCLDHSWASLSHWPGTASFPVQRHNKNVFSLRDEGPPCGPLLHLYRCCILKMQPVSSSVVVHHVENWVGIAVGRAYHQSTLTWISLLGLRTFRHLCSSRGKCSSGDALPLLPRGLVRRRSVRERGSAHDSFFFATVFYFERAGSLE